MNNIEKANINESRYTIEKVLSIKSWILKKLISIRITRNNKFEFKPGQFARIGLENLKVQSSTCDSKIWRAYSIVSHPKEKNFLEFYFNIIDTGYLTPLLAELKPGDTVYLHKQAFGCLTLDRFKGAKNIWLLATGTGISAFLPILDDFEETKKYSKIFLIHSVRKLEDLSYREKIEKLRNENEYQKAKINYFPIITREKIDGIANSRLGQMLDDGSLERYTKEKIEPVNSRVMLCGNPQMINEVCFILKERGFYFGRKNDLGNLAIENYWNIIK